MTGYPGIGDRIRLEWVTGSNRNPRPDHPGIRNPDLKAKYTALRHVGKPAKVAIIAIMRKLLETANALVKGDRIWVKKTSCS